MNASASGADRPDIRVGDLIKATSKENPEESVTGRVRHVSTDLIATSMRNLTVRYYDFKVLDRPLPPVDEGLIRAANNVWLGRPADALGAIPYRNDWANVINYLREHDTYNKESK